MIDTIKIDNPKMKILDCTLRDGGYVNNWKFDMDLAKNLYNNLSGTGVDYIEIGFQNISKKDEGIWYSVTDELIEEVTEGSIEADIVVMVDLGRCNLSEIKDAHQSPISMYRITCNKDQINEAIHLANQIKIKGYKVSLQLKRITDYSMADVQENIPRLSAAELDYIYIVDSFGSLYPHQLEQYIKAFKRTNKKIGFHGHNNLQLAFANTLTAMQMDIDIIDATVEGIGRGGGNLPLELILLFLNNYGINKKYNMSLVLDFIDSYFKDLHKDYRWGYSIPYIISGIKKIHPNYLHNLIDHSSVNLLRQVEKMDLQATNVI